MTFTFDPNAHAKAKKEDGYTFKSDKPTIETLVPDIYSYMGGHGDFPELDEDAAKELAKDIAEVAIERFKERRGDIENHNNCEDYRLRMSGFGAPNRKLWYEANVGHKIGQDDPRLFLNFLLGDVWESIILFLAKQTGHKVEMEQAEVELDGMVGHMDAVIDDVLIDVKSASSYAFKNKFTNGAIFTGGDADPFSYVPQLKGYGEATGIDKQGWLVANKETGELALVKMPNHVQYDAKEKLNSAREAIAQPEPPPEKCYEPIPHGKAGNMQLAVGCRYCPFKEQCWKDDGLRAFTYSTGPVYMTHVEKAPRVDELDIYGEWDDIHDEDQY